MSNLSIDHQAKNALRHRRNAQRIINGIAVDPAGGISDGTNGLIVNVDGITTSINGSDDLIANILPIYSADPVSPTSGQAWYNSTTDQAKLRMMGLNQFVVSSFFVLTSIKTLANPQVLTDFGAGITTVPANQLKLSRTLLFSMAGRWATGTVNTTLGLKMFFGGATGTAITQMVNFNGGNAIPTAGAGGWSMQVFFTITGTGGSGGWQSGGSFVSGGSGGLTQFTIGVTAGPGVIDTTLATTFGVGAVYGTNNAGNSITLSSLVAQQIF